MAVRRCVCALVCVVYTCASVYVYVYKVRCCLLVVLSLSLSLSLSLPLRLLHTPVSPLSSLLLMFSFVVEGKCFTFVNWKW